MATQQYILSAFIVKLNLHGFFNDDLVKRLDIRVNKRFCPKLSLFDKGYKYCNKCFYLANTELCFCPACGSKYRTKLINKKSLIGRKMFSEPIINAGNIGLDKLNVGVKVK